MLFEDEQQNVTYDILDYLILYRVLLFFVFVTEPFQLLDPLVNTFKLFQILM